MLPRWLSRRRPPRRIPDVLWQRTLADYPFLLERAGGPGDPLRAMATRFLDQKEFHGAQGLVVTDAMAVAIAAQAVVPVLALGLSWYDDFVGIVVHPDEVVARREVTDESGVVHHFDEVLSGEAMEGGPVMLSWHDVAGAGASAADGYNVVIHEFVHKIDMRDGAPDGCPPLATRAARDAWRAVIDREFDRFRERTVIAERFGGEPTWLDPYGAQSVDEFFAVASEAYFVNRSRFVREHAELAALFDGFFGAPDASRATAP